ncbi:MAG: C4-dicarboxylate ABC transporter permease [Candidatus Nealsonbacteria bacterium]|nr:MAG: C4-dicarboxylate ABC transporter permease [Candidatus Nealsonbacteria bacterium]
MLIILVVSLFSLLAIGVPIFIALNGASFLSLSIGTSIPPIAFVQRMFGGLDKFGLMAIPFFIFAANIMNNGGMARRILNLANKLVGGFRAGLALTTIVSCMFFGAMSGSAPATVVAIGSIIFPALIKANYGESFSAGLVTSSSSVALLIPPSVTMIVYGAATGVSVGALFMAGIGAGIIYGVCFILYSILHTCKAKVVVQKKSTLKQIFFSIKDAFWALGVPVIIIGGIYGGVFTPTEAAAVSAAYSIIISMFVYKELDFKKLYESGVESAATTAMVMIMIAGASALSWVLTVGGIPQYISGTILGLTESKIAILIAMNIIMLIAGMFVDGVAFILILAPIFLPIALKIGVDPIHLGIIMVANGAIGMFTPPFGLNLFVASGPTGLPFSRIVKGIWPFIAVSILSLIVITYVPVVSMWLPNILYK